MSSSEASEIVLATENSRAATRLALDAFVRSIAVNKRRPICLLLGAGASVSSGVPSAERCIWEWKREIFVTNNPTLKEAVGELSLPGTRHRIQQWLDERGAYPKAGSVEEYSFYAADCYPTELDRRSFFQAYVSRARPHIAYMLLPLLAAEGLVRTVWTTNFDGLAARACSMQNVPCIEIGIDSSSRVFRAPQSGELRVVSMHGDYRYDRLKNTEDELQQQEAALKSEFVRELQDYDLVVAGYSGRDKSVMNAITEAYAGSRQPRLYWCGMGPRVGSQAESALEQIAKSGRDAFVVSTDGFDDLISRLALRQLEGPSLAAVKQTLAAESQSARRTMAFSAPPTLPAHLIKSNAYSLVFPSQALKLELQIGEGIDRRAWLDERVPASAGAVVSTEAGAFAYSTPSAVREAFGASLVGAPLEFTFSEDDIAKDGRLRSLLRRGLVRGLAHQHGINSDGNRRIWERNSYKNYSTGGQSFTVHRALSIKVLSLEGKVHVVLMPEVMVLQPDGQEPESDIRKSVRNAVYGFQHNDVFNEDLKYWTSTIADHDVACSGGGVFRIAKAPIFAGLVDKTKRTLPEAVAKHARQCGMVVQDASLIFASKDGKTEVRGVNPLKSLVENRPWDFSLTASGLSPSVDLSAICPSRDSARLKKFFSAFHEKAQPARTERDYLHDFPGFSAAFGLPLTCALPGDAAWQLLEEPVAGGGISVAKNLATRICRALDVIRGLRPASVVGIFIPTRWAEYKVVEGDDESFNLHHFVKAYAARQGQSTQFIREETTNSSQPCRVRWWLSLALYAKALRTPWRFEALDNDTAFVGIGYSLDSKAARGQHVLLGCSHIYSARGEGLQFRLGRIENPIIRGRNPFMSEDDARRTGETIRQLFFEARMRLPTRVVVHKRTRFTDEEQRGLIQGLSGVSNVELIEVHVEESFRYLASKPYDGQLQIDKFPVPRGGLVIQNENAALLWVHGSTPSVQNRYWKYYQGKRRIPAPLSIRRYMGQSDVVQVATEILGLSKMNWNTFDYYSRLPATLDSASAIAQVGPYLSGFGNAPYDYRLLI